MDADADEARADADEARGRRLERREIYLIIIGIAVMFIIGLKLL